MLKELTMNSGKNSILAAALDIGSGMTKMIVGELQQGRIVRFLEVCEAGIPFGVIYKEHNKLTQEVIDEGISVLQDFKKCINKHGVEQCNTSAIGTEVFTKASNGKSFLKLVKEKVGIHVRLVSQLEEAMLGYLSGKAMLEMRGGLPNGQDVIVYDSGGGSFQITKQKGKDMIVYLKAYGTAPSLSDLYKIKGISSGFLHKSPNPCTISQVKELVQVIRQHLRETDKVNVDNISWLKGETVVGIGSLNSIFRITSEFLGGSMKYGLEDIGKVLFEDVVDRTDDELESIYRVEKGMEPAIYCIPKLALLYTVLLHTGIKYVVYEPVIGSCPGILIQSQKA